MCFISMYIILNTLFEYTYFYMSKTWFHTLFLLVLKMVKSLQKYSLRKSAKGLHVLQSCSHSQLLSYRQGVNNQVKGPVLLMQRLAEAESTRKIKKQTKQMEELATYDIRDMFKAGQQEKGNNTKTAIEIDALYLITYTHFFYEKNFYKKMSLKNLKTLRRFTKISCAASFKNVFSCSSKIEASKTDPEIPS